MLTRPVCIEPQFDDIKTMQKKHPNDRLCCSCGRIVLSDSFPVTLSEDGRYVTAMGGDDTLGRECAERHGVVKVRKYRGDQ